MDENYDIGFDAGYDAGSEVAYEAGFEAGMKHAKDITWHFLLGQADAEFAQSNKAKSDHTLYLQRALHRFLKAMIE